MRSELLVVLSLFTVAACVRESGHDEEIAGEEAEETEAAVEVTSTPGKAVWTKVWRWSTSAEPLLATDVTSDETGAAFLTRARTTSDDIAGEASVADVARYSATGSLSYRVRLPSHERIVASSLQVAARGGRLVTAATQRYTSGTWSGSIGRLSLFDASTGRYDGGIWLEAANARWTENNEPRESAGSVAIRSIAARDDGGFVVLAAVSGTAQWGPFHLPDQDGSRSDVAVARFDARGQIVAARRFEGATAHRVRLDGQGNLYVVVQGLLTSPRTQTSYGVQKLTASLLVTDYFFLEGDATITAMDVSRGGRVTFGGNYHGTLHVGPSIRLQEPAPSKYGEAYAAKLDPGMNAAYARSFASSSRAIVSGIGIDSYGQVVVAMSFLGSLAVDDTTYTAPGSDEWMALVKLSATGFAPRWSKAYAATSALRNYVRATALDITDSDRILVAGSFRTDVDFGRGTIDGSPAGNAFLTRFYP